MYIVLISLLSLIFGIDEAEIVFAGDAMMHQGQIDAGRKSDGTYDFSEYFDEIDGYVGSADYAVVNLETPVSPPPYSGYPCFNAPESYIDALSDAGFDMFLTANNHTLDRHSKGLKATVDALDQRRLDHIGTYVSDSARSATIPFVKNINGIKVGFLNYTYGTNGITPGKDVAVDYIDKDLIRRDVDLTRADGAEIVIVCIHWGIEYQLIPHKSQKELANFLKEVGVDIVIGGHPHVVQPMELTTDHDRQHLVVYSLGNLISNMKTRDTRGGAMVKVKLTRADDGKVKISDANYRLVFTEPPSGGRNYRLQWVDRSSDARAKSFSEAARSLFGKYNKNVREDFCPLNRR